MSFKQTLSPIIHPHSPIIQLRERTLHIHSLKQKSYLIWFLIFFMCMVSVQAIYRNPPPYFNSFYCNLGSKGMTDSGDYTCSSPKVIERADNFALALVEFNKPSTAYVWFKAQIVSSPGVNLTAIRIRLEFKTAYTTRYGYMVLAIGYQAENDWLDVINFKLPEDQSQTQVILPTIMTVAGQPTHKLRSNTNSFTPRVGSCDYVREFITSYGAQVTGPGTQSYIDVYISSQTATSFTTTIYSYQQVNIKNIFYGVVVLKTSSKPSNVELLTINNKGMSTSTLPFNFHTNNQMFGPSFNTKCLLMIRMVLHFGTVYTIQLTNSTLSNYHQLKLSSDSFAQVYFNFLCLADTSTSVLGEFDYFDQLTGQFYPLGNNCPVPTTTFAPPNNYCLKCSQPECVNCNPSARSECYQCNSPLFVLNCLTCVLSNCPQCAPGYGLTSSGLCANCSSWYSNCGICSSYNSGCTECATGYGFNSSGSCVNCSNWYSNCAICNSHNSGCTKCVSGYGFNSLGSCVNCASQYSNCALCNSQSSGCTECEAGYGFSSSGSCVPCSNWYNNCDLCNSYNSGCTKCSTTNQIYLLYDGQCYYLPGCSNIYVINDLPKCIACNTLNFQYDNNEGYCTCQRGFYLSPNDDTCDTKCGDGIKVFLQSCDDGNLINGDGCSDTCEKETNFVCYENNLTPSLCIFSQNILITLNRIMKVENQNWGQIYFEVYPTPNTLNSIIWDNALNFTFADSIKKPVMSFTYSYGVLIAKLAYFQDIEGTSCQMEVKFNSSVINSYPQFLNFQLSGLNDELTYQSQIIRQNKKIVSIASFAVGVAALCCFIFSTFYHKMIGLETLQFIQLIYFVRIIFSGEFDSNVLAFNSLKYSNGYNQVNLPGKISFPNFKSIPSIFLKIKLSIYYLDNTNLMMIPIILATFAYALYLFLTSMAQNRYNRTKEISIKDKIIHLRRNVHWIYDNFIFSYSLSLFYLTTFQILVYELSDLSIDHNANSLYVGVSFGLNLVIFFYILAIFCSQTISGFQAYFDGLNNKQNHFGGEEKFLNHENKDYHPLYVPFYLLYQFCLVILLNSVLLDFNYAAEAIGSLNLLYTVVFYRWKPYTLNIHNNSNIFNQAVVLIFLFFSVLGKYDLLNDTIKIISLYTTITLIVFALILQVVRVYVYKKSLKRQLKIEVKNKKQKPIQLNQIKQNNPYMVSHIISKKIIQKGAEVKGLMEQVDESTILGRETLRELLRKQILNENRKQKRLNSKQEDWKQDDNETLKIIKKSIRAGLKSHEQWIFK